jgi:protein SCO1/2
MMRVQTIVAALLVLACTGCAPEKFRATDITGASFAREFQLTGHDGKSRTLADFKGKVVVLFFGYTHCPDVCPTTLAQFGEAARQLGADAARVQVLFVTVDPERDTKELLEKYVPAFNPNFLGLYGDAEALARTAKEFKIIFQKQPGRTPETYTVDHSAGTYVYDHNGRVRLFVRHDRPVEDLVHDIRLLLAS